MSGHLIVHKAGPGLSVQDAGRPGYLGFGLSRGGAVDPVARAEGAALLGQNAGLACLEMAGMGGEFEVTRAARVALTGAPMAARIDGNRIAWNASHALPAGARLSIGGAESGAYGYLHVGGGLDMPECLGSCSLHVSAGLGAPVEAGAQLPLGDDPHPEATGLHLVPEQRFSGGTIRVVPSLQTDFFGKAEITRFEKTVFRRGARGNRMGVPLLSDEPGLHSEAGLSVLSEVIVPGDIQVTGDGTPFVLLADCQTTGGYPRLCSVLPCDLPCVAQAAPGAQLQFRFVSLDEAMDAERRARTRLQGLRSAVQPLIRDPHQIRDLLSYQLIGGVTAGDDIERGP